MTSSDHADMRGDGGAASQPFDASRQLDASRQFDGWRGEDPSAVWRGTLTGVLDAIWGELEAATKDRRHGFHTPAIASIGVDGAPQARSVVLRRVLRHEGELHFHTDVRSPKVAEIARNPQVAWLLYDAARRLQLRIEAKAAVLREGPRADEAWTRSALSSRRCYLAPHAPGEIAEEWTANIPEALAARVPTEEESAAGRVHFGLVVTKVTAIESLFLASEGHRRARFVADASGVAWLAHWLAP